MTQVLALVLYIGDEGEERQAGAVIEVDDPRAAAFAASLQPPPKLANAARARDQVAAVALYAR